MDPTRAWIPCPLCFESDSRDLDANTQTRHTIYNETDMEKKTGAQDREIERERGREGEKEKEIGREGEGEVLRGRAVNFLSRALKRSANLIYARLRNSTAFHESHAVSLV